MTPPSRETALSSSGLGGAQVAVVLTSPVDSPLLGVDVVLRDLDEPDEGALGLLLVLKDVHEQAGHDGCSERRGHHDGGVDRDGALAS